MRYQLFITCEHASNLIPPEYEYLWGQEERSILSTHRAYDIGALEIFKQMAKRADYSDYGEASRLLVDLNRSPRNRNRFSRYTRGLKKKERETLLSEYYFPYRNRLFAAVGEAIASGVHVLHVAVHSFTRSLEEGEVRKGDIGLLYDPSNRGEKSFCLNWKKILISMSLEAGWVPEIRFNYPYKGVSDGLPTWLRRQFPSGYKGVELEICQDFLKDEGEIRKIADLLSSSLKETLSEVFG